MSMPAIPQPPFPAYGARDADAAEGQLGLGFELSKPEMTPRLDHFGVNAGFVSVLQAYPDGGSGIVIMTNGQDGEKLITEILRAVGHEYGWPDFNPQSMSSRNSTRRLRLS